MTAPKVGDGVRFEIDTVVRAVEIHAGAVAVKLAGLNGWVAAKHCTITRPALAVGAAVRWYEPEPPLGTVMLASNGKVWQRTSAGWETPGESWVRSWLEEMTTPLTVLHVGGES